jgi:PKD repeat protein
VRGGAQQIGLVVAALCIVLAVPETAAATTYCVNEPLCHAAGGIEEGNEGVALQKTLEKAGKSAGPNVLVIGAGVYSHAKGFTYNSAEALTITGAGAGNTVFTSNAEEGASVLTLSSANTKLSGVTVSVPAGKSQVGIALEKGTVEHTSVTGGGGLNVPTGLDIATGAVFTHGSIEMDEATASTGVDFNGGEVIDSTIAAYYGTQGADAETLRGCRISSPAVGVLGYYANITVEDTLIDLRARNSAGVSVVGNGNGNAQGTLRNLTIVNGGAGSIGVELEANKAHSSSVSLESSVIADVGHAILERTSEAGSKTSAATAYSSYEAAGDEQLTEGGGTVPSPPSDENPVSTTTDFVKPVLGEHGFSEGDWALAPTSPLIDAGKPGALGAGEYELDAAGDSRIVNGRRDVGAYEYQRRAPSVTGGASATTVKVGESVTFTGSATAVEPGDTIASYQWTFDEGASVGAGASATHSFATAGVHKATLTVTDAAGVTSTEVVDITVQKQPEGVRIPPAPCGKPCPFLSSLILTPTRFRAARSGPSVTNTDRTGTRVSFTLAGWGSHQLPVVFKVERLVRGFAHGRMCLAARPLHRAKRCTRHIAVHGRFSITGAMGANALRFTGRIDGHALTPGRYLLIATVEFGNSKSAAFEITA